VVRRSDFIVQGFPIYALAGVTLLVIGLYAAIVHPHLVRKVLAVNVMGSGVFLMFLSLAKRTDGAAPDPVPQAMVLTGIVVAISATALALILVCRIQAATGEPYLSGDGEDSS
jgi:multicomponent Na+:H+ antiporter subunit C